MKSKKKPQPKKDTPLKTLLTKGGRDNAKEDFDKLLKLSAEPKNDKA